MSLEQILQTSMIIYSIGTMIFVMLCLISEEFVAILLAPFWPIFYLVFLVKQIIRYCSK